MIKEFGKLFRLRFDEKNRRMIEHYTEEKQRLNARGLLNSSETIKAMHKVLETELKESVGVVVTTAIDVINKKDLLLNENALQDMCTEALLQRKNEIEALHLSDVRHIEQGLLNKAMLQPYISLGDFYRLQQEEMLINLSAAYEKRLRERGGNLAGVLKNRFLNIPMVAWAVIVITVIIAIASFTNAIGGLRSLFGLNGQ